jgi:asparagine synthetase B (glutamine-hydrolysing)
MCGIYLTNIPISEKEVALKLNKIRFRGPDHLGIIQKENISLGHLRLSILDLDERSNQPFTFGHTSLVYNGEIYNFKEVKETLIDKGYSFETTGDTEVLLKGYHAWGEKILRDILEQYIPEKIFDQPKKGFSIPLADWIRDSFKDEFSIYLKTDKLMQIENLDITKIQRLFELHLTKDVDYSSYLWRVYVLSKWIYLNKEQK